MAPVYAWPLMMVGYSFLLYVLAHTHIQDWETASLQSFYFFFGYFLTSLYWISNSLFVDLEHWWWALPFSFMGLPFLLSLFPAVIIGIIFYTIKSITKPSIRFAFFVFALIVTDIARGNLFTGFPWNMPAHSWVMTDIIMAALPYIGFYGLNAITVVILTLPAILNGRFRVVFIGLFTMMTFIPLPSGNISNIPDNIIMIQANIPQNEKWDARYIDRNYKRYLDMSRQAITNDAPILLVWPETAISQNLLSYPDKNQMFRAFLRKLPDNSLLITGFLSNDNSGYYNSMAIFNRAGEIIAMYDKRHLVPFGEYMPFGLDTITGFNNFQSGHEYAPIRLDDKNITIIPLICYEVIFPQYSRAKTDSGIIVNITNDSWFGNSAGPYQHFDHAIFRAVENKAPLLRLSGSGLSGIIDSNGQIRKISRLNGTAIIKTP